MTKARDRWSYIDEVQPEEQVETPVVVPSGQGLMPIIQPDALRSVPRREGRTEQKTQLNIRIPKELKRLAVAQAALEGRNIGDLVETLLIEHLERVSAKARGK